MSKRTALLLLPLVVTAACGDNPSGSSDALDGSNEPAYLVGSIVSSPGGSTAYVNVIGSLDAQTLDYMTAYEFPGNADVWSWSGKVFVADGATPIIRRYRVDGGRALVLERELSFQSYGLLETSFWNAIWISPTKAYMANGQGEYVIWNPETMAITGTMPHPPLADRGLQLLRLASTDRGVVVHGNRLYHPFYWVNGDYTDYAPDGGIAVYDTDTDTLVGMLDAPCPGLDIATADDTGNMYFSNWTGNVGLTLVNEATAPCGIKLAAGASAVDPAWSWPEITEGRLASALRYSGDGHAVLSVFHQERVDLDAATDPWAVVGSANWRIWNVDLANRQAAPVDGIDWNSGATYMQRIDDTAYVLVPGAGYATSQVYAVDGASATRLFETRGYGIRLFRVR
jgi:hypothetical protein